MSWFKRDKPGVDTPSDADRTVRTEGLWVKCEGCKQIIFRQDLEENHNVCSKCNYHFRIDARERMNLLFDKVWTEFDADLVSTDPMTFSDSKPYKARLKAMQESTGSKDAVLSGQGRIGTHTVNACAMELKFIGGSMGAVVGEKITRAVERSLAGRQPLVVVSATGGARMQEGAVSLMQMAKISSALMRLDEASIPYISILTDPTTGGVTASFAMLGDLNIAEPGALIGFAGPRVIEQTIRQKLPEGFQRSEFLVAHGFLDAIVSRQDLRPYLARSFDFFVN
ncbi:acetyl-CoA carboxylase, carboxyltransferase subunit beta [Bryobacter aggregatus]|uniref:acetyl-CoA carboxylase, carboxyltransferase subunit beta n=1 Tax=Bryobacter aggregatus TaxID=360054 RepID=UPI0004E0ED19|nr:acetyl-CoA carboxylase, carboxyltransferase subunit beta [Bryobacter aggregatus]